MKKQNWFQRLFARKYALSRLHLPRNLSSFYEDAVAGRAAGAVSLKMGGEIRGYIINFEELAREIHSESPYVCGVDGHACAILRLESISADELPKMREAIKQSRILFLPVLARCPTYPILGLRFLIYDNLTRPFIVEGTRDIQTADAQDFLQGVLNDGGGEFFLYAGAKAEPIGSGTFSLCGVYPRFFLLSTNKKLNTYKKSLWLLLSIAAQYLKHLPVEARDFKAAQRYYEERTSLTTEMDEQLLF